MKLHAPTSVGDLADRITILDIKLKRLQPSAKMENVRYEHACLHAVWASMEKPVDLGPLGKLLGKLRTTNERIWDLEEEAHLPTADVGTLRGIIEANDERARLKRSINLLLNSEIIEEKSHKGGRP